MTKHLRIAVLALASLLMGPSAHTQELPMNAADLSDDEIEAGLQDLPAPDDSLGAFLERVALVLESGQEPEVLQAGARRLAMTLARALQLTLLCEHAQWMIDHGGDRRGYAAAMRFARQPVDLMTEVDPEADRLLLG